MRSKKYITVARYEAESVEDDGPGFANRLDRKGKRSLIRLNPQYIGDKFETIGLNKKTIDLSLVFYHELLHTFSLRLLLADPTPHQATAKGAVVRKVNKIRKQLALPKRATYNSHIIDGYQYLPFSPKARKLLLEGQIPRRNVLRISILDPRPSIMR